MYLFLVVFKRLIFIWRIFYGVDLGFFDLDGNYVYFVFCVEYEEFVSYGIYGYIEILVIYS